MIDGTALSPHAKGVGKYSLHLINQLSARLPQDWTIDVLALKGQPMGDQLHSRASVLPVPAHSELAKGFFLLPRMAHRMKADIILLPMESATAPLRAPTVTILHDITRLIDDAAGGERNLARKSLDAMKMFFRRGTLRRSFAVICNSEFTAQEAHARYAIPLEKIHVGYCGIDSRFYEDDYLRPEHLWPQLGVWSGYVLTFATGDPRERFDLVPEVWASVHDALPRVGLVVAGVSNASAYCETLKKKFTSAGMEIGRDVLFVPFLSETEFPALRSLYRCADFYLELSGHEGFGMQLAEAMAVGTTCISSGRGALHEVAGGYAVEFSDMTTNLIADTIISSYAAELQNRDNSKQVDFTRRYSWGDVGAVATLQLLALALHGSSTETFR
jgi:glycosyltransferase involved in cell wall biosynthesis